MLRKIQQFLSKLRQPNTDKLRNIGFLIQQYYLNKNSIEQTDIDTLYSKSRAEIFELGITQLKIKGSTVVIVLQRPGLLIGRHGINIDALTKFVKATSESEYERIDIEEDKVIDSLFPYHYSDFDY